MSKLNNLNLNEMTANAKVSLRVCMGVEMAYKCAPDGYMPISAYRGFRINVISEYNVHLYPYVNYAFLVVP